MGDINRINRVFGAIKDILGDGDMPILDLVDALEEGGFETTDISYANAYLMTYGRLEMGVGYTMRVADETPFSLGLVS